MFVYRRNPDHFKQFSHPDDSEEEEGEPEEQEEEEEESENIGKAAARDRWVSVFAPVVFLVVIHEYVLLFRVNFLFVGFVCLFGLF